MIRSLGIAVFITASQGVYSQDSLSLEALTNLEASEIAIQSSSMNARDRQLVLTAKRLGTAGGFSEYWSEANQILEKHKHTLNQAYYFPYVMIPTDTDAQVLPPVIEEYGASVSVMDGGTAIEERDARLEIKKLARLVTHNHSWRTYLTVPLKKIDKGDPREWPRSPEEKLLWTETLQNAWENGRKQAAVLFDKRFNDLENEFIGMLRYMEYVEKGMLREIFVAGNELGVQLSKDGRSMQIGGRFVRITKQSTFNADPADWKPISIPVVWEDDHD